MLRNWSLWFASRLAAAACLVLPGPLALTGCADAESDSDEDANDPDQARPENDGPAAENEPSDEPTFVISTRIWDDTPSRTSSRCRR